MTERLEDRLVEALEKVDIHGDVASEHVHDPMTMILREGALQDDLMRWHDNQLVREASNDIANSDFRLRGRRQNGKHQ